MAPWVRGCKIFSLLHLHSCQNHSSDTMPLRTRLLIRGPSLILAHTFCFLTDTFCLTFLYNHFHMILMWYLWHIICTIFYVVFPLLLRCKEMPKRKRRSLFFIAFGQRDKRGSEDRIHINSNEKWKMARPTSVASLLRQCPNLGLRNVKTRQKGDNNSAEGIYHLDETRMEEQQRNTAARRQARHNPATRREEQQRDSLPSTGSTRSCYQDGGATMEYSFPSTGAQNPIPVWRNNNGIQLLINWSGRKRAQF